MRLGLDLIPRLAAALLAAALLLGGALWPTNRSAAPHLSGFHVDPNGKPNGDGSAERPWDLATALARPSRVKPGDTLWMHGGAYHGTFVSTLAGAPNHPIVLRQLPGERATIDGGLVVRGAHAVYWGFEVTNAEPRRAADHPGANPADYQRPTAVDVFAPDTKFINLVVHDAGSGFGFPTPAVDAEIYGCLIYNNGWEGPDRGHGHGIYAQNRDGTKRIVDNVIFSQFGFGLHAYGSEAAYLSGFHIEGNVFFNNGAIAQQPGGSDVLVGGGRPAEAVVVTRNFTYANRGSVSARFGYEPAVANRDLTLTDNYLVGVTELQGWRELTVTGNTFTAGLFLIDIRAPQGQRVDHYVWRDNAYRIDPAVPANGPTRPFFLVQDDTSRALDFREWRATTGLDSGSSAKRGRPRGTRVFVRANRYESGRAHLIVYNWDRAKTVTLDLSQLLRPGDRYEIRDAQDFYGAPVAEGVYQGLPLPRRLGGGLPLPRLLSTGNVRVSMKGRPPAPALGVTRSAPVTEPEFAVFVLIGPSR